MSHWTLKRLKIYAWKKFIMPRSLGHMFPGWLIGITSLVSWPVGAIAAYVFYKYEDSEEKALMYHGTHLDKTEKTAGIDYYGAMVGVYQIFIVWLVVRGIMLFA